MCIFSIYCFTFYVFLYLVNLMVMVDLVVRIRSLMVVVFGGFRLIEVED